MKKRALFIVALLWSASSYAANTFDCAGATVRFEFAPSTKSSPGGTAATLTVSRNGKSTVLRYDMNVDFIGGDCQKTPRGRSLVVFQAYCGGSACRDLDNFGIIDPSDLRVLLVPSDWNYKDAARIFGAELKPISAENMLPLTRMGGKK